MSGSEALPRAREAAEKALQLDPSLAEAHASLGVGHWWYDRDHAAARREFQTALAMQPELTSPHELNGWYLVSIGQVDEIEAALGRAHADAGNTAEATKVLDHLRRRMQDEFVSAAFLANLHIGLGQVDEAFAALAQAATEHSYYVGF